MKRVPTASMSDCARHSAVQYRKLSTWHAEGQAWQHSMAEQHSQDFSLLHDGLYPAGDLKQCIMEMEMMMLPCQNDQ